MAAESLVRGLTAAAVLLAGSACAAGPRHTEEAAPDTVQIGYGAQARKDVTSSISSVRPDEREDAGSTDIERLLLGRVSGVEIIRLPSGKVSLKIRGSSSFYMNTEPLYVIDGQTVAADNFTDAVAGLTAQQIMRIDVLKDAAATAIYGTSGANGVVVITTKRGGN